MSDLNGLRGQAHSCIVRNPYESVGILKGQGTQEKGVYNAENRGTRSDAKSDDQNREGSQPGVAPQRSEAITKILQYSVHPCTTPDERGLWAVRCSWPCCRTQATGLTTFPR